MVPGRAGFAPKAGADRAAARMMLVAIAIHLDCRIIFSSKQLDAQRAMHVIPRAETSFFRAARVPLRHSMKEIPIQLRNSTVRCKLLYYSAYPALPFPMFGRISPQTPESGTHQHSPDTLPTSHPPLP